MTEHEALKQFIPILGRISTPYERATITHKITERIAGRAGDSIMAITHKHAGALAWPNDSLMAHQFELALNVATDSGEFLSFTRITRHLRIEELASWPNCPAIAPDSPLVYWLGEPAPAQDTATPAPDETKEQRQDRRLLECEAAGLVMPKSHAGRLPDGIAGIAERIGITRQALSSDVRKALERREIAKKEGVRVHRA